MKYGFTFAKLAQENKVVNLSIMPQHSETTNESSWQIDDDILYFNHDTKKFRVERFEWSDEDGEWLELYPEVGHKEAIQYALDYNIIYKKE